MLVQVSMLSKQVMDIRLMAQHEMLLDPSAPIADVQIYMERLMEQVQSFVRASESINSYEELFRMEKSTFDELEDTLQVK